jgi:hypothetical protein
VVIDAFERDIPRSEIRYRRRHVIVDFSLWTPSGWARGFVNSGP